MPESKRRILFRVAERGYLLGQVPFEMVNLLGVR